MSLSKQIYLYSIGTDAFYNTEEQLIHKRLLKLYNERKKCETYRKKAKNLPGWKVGLSLGWRKSSLNRLIKKEKNKLIEVLNNSLSNENPRVLNAELLKLKNIVSLFDSSLVRALNLKINELTEDLIIVNVFFFQIFESLIKNGFIYNGEKYIFLTASAGQIRTKRSVFVKESAYKQVEDKLTCGLSKDIINSHGGINSNKYLAYLALNNSATDVWENFDIDKSIVVDDFETDVVGTVDFINDVTYEITRKEMPCTIPHMDGCGIMLEDKTRMIRLPWIKGLLVQFPFDKFIQEKCLNQKAIVTDIYGKEHDILKENIKYIFTKSQFKMAKYYSSWEEYKENFKKYQCEACYCNIEENYIPKARINYQMLQTLSDMTDEEISQIMTKSVEEINSIGPDYQINMRLLGVTNYNKDKSFYQEALEIYPELFHDTYSKDILKQTKKSLVKQAKAGRLRVNGKYLFLSPDLYAFCEWLFLDDMNPQGLLRDGEVYCSEFKDNNELACLRSPHLYREWPIRTNKRTKELDKWFGQTKCIYTSCHDLISRILQFDNDGDKALVIKDDLLTSIAKRNMEDIVPLYYEMKKAKGGELNSQSFYDGMSKAFTSGNIGPISNNITKVWNCGKEIGQEQLNVVKWLTMFNNFTIDMAKTLYCPDPPPEINKIIKSYTKANVPHFFIYAKDKEHYQVEKTNNSIMNRLSDSINFSPIKFSKSFGKLDYRMMMNLKYGFDIRENNPIITCFDYYNKRQNYLFNTEDDNYLSQENLYMNKYIREKILEETGADLGYVVNTLVAYYYTLRPSSTKKLLWSCFGKEIVDNLKVNTKELGNICTICGKRYKPKRYNQLTCSEECHMKMDAQNHIK